MAQSKEISEKTTLSRIRKKKVLGRLTINGTKHSVAKKTLKTRRKKTCGGGGGRGKTGEKKRVKLIKNLQGESRKP